MLWSSSSTIAGLVLRDLFCVTCFAWSNFKENFIRHATCWYNPFRWRQGALAATKEVHNLINNLSKRIKQWLNHTPFWSSNWFCYFWDKLIILPDKKFVAQLTDVLDLASWSARCSFNYCLLQHAPACDITLPLRASPSLFIGRKIVHM